ncbi:frizzled-4-like isoform X1 [Anopheles sinensis]|uniref:Frizzled-4-like isoform X1 n=1 Tax=Anopheles sinensis TaxID=74873 RepID=A0A084VMZ9_ANOSI|nr:frizzled-4-like isoform X1 [Anopheles sinensis]
MASEDNHVYGCSGDRDDQDDRQNVPDQHTNDRLANLDPLHRHIGSDNRRKPGPSGRLIGEARNDSPCAEC